MDAAVMNLVPFGDIILSLRAMRAPSLGDVLSELHEARRVTACVLILKEIKPELLEDALLINEGTLFKNEGYALLEMTLEQINEIAPIDMEQIQMDLDAGEEDLFLVPESAGVGFAVDMSMDDDYFRDNPMMLFWRAVIYKEGQALFSAAVEYGWWDYGLEMPEEWPVDALDFDRFVKNLRARGLGVFVTVYEIFEHETGNPYFDWNPYDESELMAPYFSFNVEGVRELEKFWIAAQPISEDFKKAKQQFEDDPGLAGKLLAIYLESLWMK